VTAADVLGRRALGRETLARQLLLAGGMFRGTWRVTRSGQRATLRVETFARLAGPGADAVTEEGARLLAFVAPGCDPDVVLAPQRRRSAGSVRDGGS
jgi:hypothetical protein